MNRQPLSTPKHTFRLSIALLLERDLSSCVLPETGHEQQRD
jgi:hypothetical protein